MSRHHIAEERTLNVPVSAVWAITGDTSRYAEWVEGVIEVTQNHGRATVGKTYSERNRFVGPITSRTTWTVQVVEPERLRIDAGTGLSPLQDVINTFRYTPLGEGQVKVSYEIDFTLKLGPLTRLVVSILSRGIRADFQRSLERLEELALASLKKHTS